MKRSKTLRMVRCGLFAALAAVGAFIQIPVPYMDYFTLQFLFVILSGMLLGSKDGLIAVGSYVLVGLAGVPVFAAGGGIQYVLRPSFGYLLGFVAAAYVSGRVTEQITGRFGVCRFKGYLGAALGGFLVTYGIGLVYKYLILNIYLGEPASLWILLLSCFPLDIPGDILLSFLGAALAVRLKPVLGRMSYGN